MPTQALIIFTCHFPSLFIGIYLDNLIRQLYNEDKLEVDLFLTALASQFFTIASTAEVTQNAIRAGWYFKGLPNSFGTMMFASGLALGQVFTLQGFGSPIWIQIVAILLSLASMFLMKSLGVNFALASMGISSALGALGLYFVVPDPVLILVLPAALQIIVVYQAIVTTKNQWIHCAMALTAALTLVPEIIWLWDIGTGVPKEWSEIILVMVAWIVAILILNTVLNKLPPTPNLCSPDDLRCIL